MRTVAEASLVSGFAQSAKQHPHRPALFVDGEHVTYESLARGASAIGATIGERGRERNPLAAVLAYRSRIAYAGVLGVLLSGRGYVPLNPRFPLARTRKMLEQSGTDTVVVGSECWSQVEDLLKDWPHSLTVIAPDVPSAELADVASRLKAHRFVGKGDLAPGTNTPTAPSIASNDIAYLLFTSGSTGTPKGVPVSHGNVRAYVEVIAERYGVNSNDRVSQAFDMTFDLSVHDMFVSWERGACLYCVPEAMISAPARFIRDHELTLWFSVPSVASFMSRLRLLRPGLFKTLRYSLFCGEALPAATVEAWRTAAPDSVIENLYGPTEATIAITAYRWDDETSPPRCRNGITPIGWAFEGQHTSVLGDNLTRVARGEVGELVLAGSQVTNGYWHDPAQTQARYVELDDGRWWYRTGDRVVEEDDGCLIYLGRFDDQVKIRGYRVELQEVEAVVRDVSGCEQAVAVAWPVRDGIADGVVAFVSGTSDQTAEDIVQRCRDSLPEHMVPRELHFVDEMPTNANGKTDRRKLAAGLDEKGT